MNKWEIEVERSLLASEAAAMKELEKQYKAALADIKQKIQQFQANIEQLDAALNQEGIDDATRELLLSQKRSKVYQKQFQEALQQQINGILDNMQGQNYSTIDGYLKHSYEDGYVGSMYSLAQQGVPIITPINQAAATHAILTDSKVVAGYYNRLGVDVAKLKKVISQEITRGIAASMSYAEIARNIDNASKSGLYNAQRIARTEGHRIQNTAIRDHANEARAHGADLVKIWDATLDGKTRESHRMVDGQIRELDEKFSNGLDRPGDPSGSAEEVINCRCARIHRPRWAVKDGITKMDNFTGEIRTFESPKDYAQFKEWYWSKENVEYMKYVQGLEAKYGTNDFKTILGSMSEPEYQKFHALESNSPLYSKKKYQTGGMTYEQYMYLNLRDDNTASYYEIIRNTDDVSQIAKSSGMSIQDIIEIKNHVFFNEHIKYDGESSRFDPSYNMAVAWKRLSDGVPKSRDLILLKHELLESEVEKKYNLTAAEAHAMAEEQYPWDKILESEIGELGEQDGLL